MGIFYLYLKTISFGLIRGRRKKLFRSYLEGNEEIIFIENEEEGLK
jgi:hypothetical protein